MDSLPFDVTLCIMRHATNCQYIDEFFTRTSPQSRGYYHRIIHAYLHSHNLEVLSVCRTWRRAAIPYLYKYAIYDENATPSLAVPVEHQRCLQGIFISKSESKVEPSQSATDKDPFARVPDAARTNVRYLGVWTYSGRASFPFNYIKRIRSTFPNLQWAALDLEIYHSPLLLEPAEAQGYESPTMSPIMHGNGLLQSVPLIASLALHCINTQTPMHVFALIRHCAPHIRYLDLGAFNDNHIFSVFFVHERLPSSGDEPVFETHQVLFPRLQRLHFSIGEGWASPKTQRATECIFPNIEELYCDNQRDDKVVVHTGVFSVLYGLVLSHPLPRLQHLKFGFLFDHDGYEAGFLLRSVAAHPRLQSFEYPASVSGPLPCDVLQSLSGSQLRSLMLKGWLFTLHNLATLLAHLPQLASLQTNVAPACDSQDTARDIPDVRASKLAFLWAHSSRDNDPRWDAGEIKLMVALVSQLAHLKHVYLFPKAVSDLKQQLALGADRKELSFLRTADVSELCANVQRVARHEVAFTAN
ncbi:hypothetical protein GQ54DRAFT_299546 [Martensiomyces pterosporus]|nr:hypothetical protein GQ54DRAFT_299546 [Martensiomyces pterosporus]